MTRYVIAAAIGLCDCNPVVPLPMDPPPAEPDDDRKCPAAPGVAWEDPCCLVHRCLAVADDACAEQPLCQEIVGADVVCGDQLCDGVECSECECADGYDCAAMFIDSFAGDECAAAIYCEPEFPCLDSRLEALGCM